MKKIIFGLMLLAVCISAQQSPHGFGVGDVYKHGLMRENSPRLGGDLNASGHSITNVASVEAKGDNASFEIVVQDTTFGTTAAYEFSREGVSVSSSGGAIEWNLGGSLTGVDNPTGPTQVGDLAYNNSIYVRPQVASDYLTLDSEISSWDDIGLTWTNAVRLNSAVLVTNDSAWTGWTTTGTLQGDDTILLLIGEYLESPSQSNGIAHIDADVWSDANGTMSDSGIYTNSVLAISAAPWRAAGATWRIEAGGSLPGCTPGVHVDSVAITGYADVSEAATVKDVSNLGVIDDPTNPTDVPNMRYVDQEDDADRAYTDSELIDYAADPDKTLRGAELRLGNMWVVSPADTSGDRFIVSGGEISGDGKLVGTTNDFVISKNDYPLLSFQSEASGLYVTNFNLTVVGDDVEVMLGIATNGVTAAPFAEWTEDIVVGEWSRVQSYITESYPAQSGGAYTLEFLLPLADTMYFRVMQPVGDSVATVKTDVWNFGSAEIKMTDVSNNVWVVTMSTNGTLTIVAE